MANRAGQPAVESDLIDIKDVVDKYYELEPDVNSPAEKVVFGTSGHRGGSQRKSFNEAHIVAITAAIAEYRLNQGIHGPLMIGFDTHLLSIPAFKTALEVLGATEIEYHIDSHVTKELLDLAEQGKAPEGCAIWTPTPGISHAILKYNSLLNDKGIMDKAQMSDGIVVTPSHNPPTDGGFKYNPEHGGPADSDATKVIAARANEILASGWKDVKRIDFDSALAKAVLVDFRDDYVKDLKNIVDMQAIKDAGVRIGADPLGGASVDYWGEIAKQYGINLTVVNPKVDPTFRFMTLDWDEKIRMDCSSKFSMAGLVAGAASSGKYDILTGNDADSDRHGIVTTDADFDYKTKTGKPGLMNPNHFLAVAISYLFGEGRNWSDRPKIGKTLVSSSLIDRVAEGLNKPLVEVPVGFKWFVPGLIDGSFGFGGEESAGASYLRFNEKVWTTDKDGLIMALLASEIFAKTGKTPSQIHRELVTKYGQSWYARIDAPATLEEKDKLSKLSPEQVTAETLAGEEITAKMTKAPGNGAAIGGLKVTTKNAWFAARPSGTENVYKIYAESFISEEHLAQVQYEAKAVVAKALS
ncbi:MAG: phosphoglucomutase (alpha-D-glucose-1,6-bisphosphate-dependent) [Candidatus Ancillula sp.]|jgi:phosphoglucomutase|nr:phosphoglucomutase (alpha-D-glucose-1,6-bisphosphate-dependent) [Candidatus Ancillula sp.]